jgi:hypothetical protein
VISSLLSATLTVWRAPLVTDHGADRRDWDNAASHSITKVSIQPTGGLVDDLNRTAVTARFTIIAADPDTDVIDGDRCEIDGTRYDLDGPVRRWRTGVLDHAEFNLKAVTDAG